MSRASTLFGAVTDAVAAIETSARLNADINRVEHAWWLRGLADAMVCQLVADGLTTDDDPYARALAEYRDGQSEAGVYASHYRAGFNAYRFA